MQPILKVDLSSKTISQFSVPVEWERAFLGGSALAARLLYDKLTPDLDPFASQAPLLFLNGPLSGTVGPATGRFVVCGRSPATGLWGESNCGGFWGPELRMAGFDGLWVEGQSEQPVYLWIQDGQVEIRSAKNLWGLDTYQTQAAVENELQAGKVHVTSIGIAGEACLPFALILCDHGRVAGRTGMGALMGKKRLKAVAVQGHGKIPLADLATYSGLRSEANRMLRADGETQMLRELGTAGTADYFDYLHELPKRYFQRGEPVEGLNTSGAVVKDTILAGVSACHACVIACGRVVRLEDGEKRKGPEYETLIGFGPNLMLNDPAVATRLGELCDRFGMDSISTSNIIGLAFRLYELGKLTSADTGGLELVWGDAAAAEALIHQTAHQSGFGAYLAEGSLKLARRFGAEQEAVQVNGLEAPYHDPRGATGMGLVYATSPRGACHNQSDYFLAEFGQIETSLGIESFDRHAGAEKAGNVAIHQNWRTVNNALVMCLFSNVPPEMLLGLVNAACGLDWSLPDLLRCGERGWNLKRAINNRLGLDRSNDRLPKAFTQPYDDSPPGDENQPPDFAPMLEAYYTARGWDPQTGYPTKSKLEELGLDFVIPELYSNFRS
jgi:aldehyde:ferredoxin oxidoreductase